MEETQRGTIVQADIGGQSIRADDDWPNQPLGGPNWHSSYLHVTSPKPKVQGTSTCTCTTVRGYEDRSSIIQVFDLRLTAQH